MYILKVTIEHRDGVKVNRFRCWSAEAVAEERQHQRAMAPIGSTITFEVTR